MSPANGTGVRGKGARLRPGALNLALLVPALPVVTLPNHTEHQLVPMNARAYELFREAQTIVQDEARDLADGVEPQVDVTYFHEIVDEAVKLLLPSASDDDRASLGYRTDAKFAICLAAAGQIDTVLQVLDEHELAEDDPEGNGTPGRSSRRSGLGTTLGPRSRATPGATRKAGSGSIPT